MGDNFVGQLRAKADAYRLLGVFMGLPNSAMALGVLDGSVEEDLRAISAELGICDDFGFAEVSAGFDKSLPDSVEIALKELRRDYTRLFSHPDRPVVAVREACFKEAADFDTSQLAFVSPTALDAEKRYREVGLAMSDDLRESPDHMGAELDFMSWSYSQLAEAVEGDDEDHSAFYRERITSFCQAHYLKWAEAFWRAVEGSAGTTLYQSLGAFGRMLAEAELSDCRFEEQGLDDGAGETA